MQQHSVVEGMYPILDNIIPELPSYLVVSCDTYADRQLVARRVHFSFWPYTSRGVHSYLRQIFLTNFLRTEIMATRLDCWRLDPRGPIPILIVLYYYYYYY